MSMFYCVVHSFIVFYGKRKVKIDLSFFLVPYYIYLTIFKDIK